MRVAAYSPEPGSRDTLRSKSATVNRPAQWFRGAVISGYWSAWGLPPIAGEFTLSDSGLVFQPTDASPSAGPEWQPTPVSLAYVDENDTGMHYLFRIDTGVFETDHPGPLLVLATGGRGAESPRVTSGKSAHTLVNAADSAALRNKAREIAQSPYADSLYTLFGRPRADIGLIGEQGQRAGRLGEYIASRDSLALDPGRMIGETQLRHALAHELGHRWQARAKPQMAALWAGVSPIKDPERYGCGDPLEHQAEAIAFAVSFLQTTATATAREARSLSLLDHYELLVPGTRIMVRYLSLQPLYRNHPLRLLLTT
ncbi:MAG TPA: hypothetical protein VFX42_09075, partial [Gemmatimonadales bacterium]|nr:hypothetical protein [Gemmatimonadales bacterium]